MKLVRRIALAIAVFGLLFLFLVSIQLVGDSFKLFGRDLAEKVFEFTNHPLTGLFIGIFATSLVQSSSTTTSIVVGLVGAGTVGAGTGHGLSVEAAVPIIMGANIGTSVTNTLVSIGHIARGNEFKRAFAAATVHDFFNILAVLILFPLQVATGFLSNAARWFAGLLAGGANLTFSSPVKAVVKPASHAIKDAVSWCTDSTTIQAIVLLLIAAVFLFLSLKYLTTVLRGAVVEKASTFFERTVFRTPTLAFTVGMILTAVVQSSSVTTSMVVPLAGAGILTLRQVFPYTLGANIGTTITALLASLAVTANFQAAVAVAISHFLFNVCGILVITPLPAIRHLPLRAAESLAEQASRRRWVPVVYVLVVFFIIPGILILLTR